MFDLFGKPGYVGEIDLPDKPESVGMVFCSTSRELSGCCSPLQTGSCEGVFLLDKPESDDILLLPGKLEVAGSGLSSINEY